LVWWFFPLALLLKIELVGNTDRIKIKHKHVMSDPHLEIREHYRKENQKEKLIEIMK